MENAETDRLAKLRSYDILDTPSESCFDLLTQLAARTCEMPIALISVVDEERVWFKSSVGLDATEAARKQTLCAHTILGTQPLIVNDASVDSRFATSALVQSGPEIRFYAGVPLTSRRGFALGTLCVIDRRPRTLTDEHVGTLKLLGEQIVQQFELHRIAETLRRQSDSLARTQAAAHIGGWELDLLTKHLSWSEETYRIHELDPDTYVPEVASALSFYSASSGVQIRAAVNALIEFGTPYDLELQLMTQTGRHRWVRATGQRDWGDDADHRVYGVLQDITERRNLESEVILIAQREQNRIGLDLHDGLGQTLTGISLLLRHATAHIPDTFSRARQEFKEIEDLVTEAIGTCRGLAHGLAPVSEERGGLPHALQKLGMQLEHVHGIKISVDIHGFVRLPEPVADHLYLISQEALTNAIRHASAQHIELRVELNPVTLLLSVIDDGTGMPDTAAGDGMGISIMRYRARLIGAVLTIERRDSGGTELTCALDMAHLGEPARDVVWALQQSFDR